MRLLNLFITALVPVLKVLLITGLGSFLGTERVNILGQEARKHLNNAAFYVFFPSLVGSNLAKTITYKTMAMLWFMPINILITFVAGSVFGWLIVKITRAPNHLHGLVLGCCAAGNLGNIPIIIIPAICKEKGTPFGAVDACQTHGLAYATLSMAIGAVYLWLYVYNLIRIYSTKNSMKAELEMPSTSSAEEVKSQAQEQKAEQGLLPLQDISSLNDCCVDRLELDTAITKDDKTEKQEQITGKVKQWLGMKLRNLNLRRVFAPSTIAAIIGFVIGTVPVFRMVLIGNTAPLRVIQDSVSMLGDAAIPIITIILGANLVKGLKGSDIHLSVVVGIVTVKFLALPLLGTLVVRGATRLGLVSPDPLYQFVLLLQFAVPPAMNIGTITQLFGVGEKEFSVIMLWTSALATMALTFWSAFFLWLVS